LAGQKREDTMEWYIVHTLTGKENAVKTTIQKTVEARNWGHLLGRILVPTETEIRSSGGKRKEVQRKLYPGYLIIEAELTDELRHLIQDTPAVTHFVGSSDSPVPLTEEEVAEIMRTVGEEGRKPKAIWEEGQAVRVTEGPFAEFTGNITEVNIEHETVKVLISIFGRETPVELDFTQIEEL